MDNKSSSTDRVRRLRARRSRGIVMSSLVEVGEGGIELLMSNGLLKHEEKEDRAGVRKAVEGAPWNRKKSNHQKVFISFSPESEKIVFYQYQS